MCTASNPLIYGPTVNGPFKDDLGFAFRTPMYHEIDTDERPRIHRNTDYSKALLGLIGKDYLHSLGDRK